MSRNARGFVGSSIAVSAFLRPRCLYKRINSFKLRLKEAVVFAKALPRPSDDEAMNTRWSSKAYTDSRDQATGSSSTAFSKRHRYAKDKDPCGKCQNTFKNLGGFIRVKDPNSAGSAGGDRSPLGACAEYCPVNELIPDDNVDNVENETQLEMFNRLETYREQCSSLFTGIRELCELANELAANNVRDAEKQLKESAKVLALSLIHI